MPSATATLSLNVSAIKILCRVPATRSGTTTPATSSGYAGDFYYDYGTEYPVYDLWGPKESDTSDWPPLSAGMRIPSMSLLTSVSTTLFSDMSSLSAATVGVGGLSATSVTITNSGTRVALTVTQNDPLTSYSVAAFNYLGSPVMVINKAQVGINNPSPLYALDVIGTVNATGSLQGSNLNVPTITATTVNTLVLNTATLSSTGDVNFSNDSFIITTSPAGVPYYRVITTNASANLFIHGLSAYTLVVSPPSISTPAPVLVSNTVFKVASGFNVISGATDNFFVVDPTSTGRTVTVNGLLSALSTRSVGYYDQNGAQLLTTRQSAPAQVTAAAASSADLVASFNTLLGVLTAHGLIR